MQGVARRRRESRENPQAAATPVADPAAALLQLSLPQARLLHLAAQGLLQRPTRKARPARLLAAISEMQLLQIDTINVVARSPYLVLFSRLGAYPPQWLDVALAEGSIFECWAHEACFAPTADFALHRHDAVVRGGHWAMKHALRAQAQDPHGMAQLLARVRADGPLRTSDFARAAVAGNAGWWGWKPEKRQLEAWFALGELMVARRENFQRVYDLSERVIGRHQPGWNDSAPLSAGARRPQLIARAVRALGVTQARWIADYFRLGKRITAADLAPLLGSGELVQVGVRGWDEPGYVHRDHATRAAAAAAGRLRVSHTTLLSPFDPVVWDRSRAREFFDFDYTLECYTPAPKRQHGYFVLPILHRGRLVGRLDAKAHRAPGTFEVKSIGLEHGVVADQPLVTDVARAIQECADWHATPAVEFAATRPRPLISALRAALR